MRILADENMPAVPELFGDRVASIVRVPGRAITNRQLQHADVLLVRSITPVTPELLSGTPVRFVGSATIGTDHIDIDGLAAAGIGFAHAPGCNADSVVDYVLAALCDRFKDQPDALAHQRVAVIGAGEVGGRLVRRLRRIGLSVVVYDPPRQQAGTGPVISLNDDDFVSLEAAFRCDIVCCHTPLTTAGPDRTDHLITPDLIDQLPQGALVLNAGRGRVTPAATVREAVKSRPDVRWVLDVWECEPDVPSDLRYHCWLATGHIAGYALDGRIRGSWMMLDAVGKWAGWSDLQPLSSYLPASEALVLADAEHRSVWSELVGAVRQAYPLRADHERFLAMMAGGGADAFDTYRKNYPARREFSQRVLTGASGEAADLITNAGFRLA